ncbi:aspartate/glutamate racemase family protein, partial [Lichenihabitans sp. Uapishka_5]|uniref:aspartate/glutamate racemase family protein n=1 Tax=Lichenihabitans sp. Uapishka_5 TaxID=3037302 RepID=UPI0029E7E882
MHIRIINPNTTAAFTARLQAAGAAVAAPGTRVTATQPRIGPASVESHGEEARAAVGVVQAIAEGEREDVDAYVVACFGDTGVHAAREVARGPVVGITEAALYTAAMLAPSFAIITLPRRTRVHALRVVHETGLTHRCTVRAIDVAVQDLAEEAVAVLPAVLAEARLALVEDGAEALILGCAGMTELVAPLEAALGVPVIDGVLAGLKMAEGLVAAGLRTSKRCSYAPPPSGPG